MSDIYAPKAQEARRLRVAKFAEYLIGHQGESLEEVMKAHSLATGVSLKTLAEYWEIISNGNKGAIYARYGIIRVRGMFKKWLK